MLEIGAILQNRYRVVAPLGEGGMGTVYRAWDARLSVEVALKEMMPQSDLDAATLEQLRQQFHQEATVLARLDHPNLVGVTDFFEERSRVYLVMKFIDGESLSARIQHKGALPEGQVLAWAEQLLNALSYCHSQGIIHRDIKPQNIIIRANNQAVLVDFGLVKLWNANDPRTKTIMRGIGTPEYAPPEQYDASMGHTDPRSDLYSLGATLYHALNGEAPPTATLRIADPGCFAQAWTKAKGVSSKTRAAITKSLELARTQRWPNAAAMGAALGLKVSTWGSPNTPAFGVPGLGETLKMPEGTVGETAVAAAGQRRSPVWIWALLGLLGIGVLVGAVLAGDWVGRQFFSETTPTQLVAALPGSATVSPTPTTTSPPATATPTAWPVQTSTPKPAAVTGGATKTPTATPRVTPMPSRTPTATLKPSTAQGNVTPSATPTRTPTPGATEVAGAVTPASGAWVTFEQWGGWTRGNQPYGELAQSTEHVKTGNYAAKLTYAFPATQDDYVVFKQSRTISSDPNTFGAWVYGDGSGHYVNLWIEDAQGQVWSVYLGRVGGAEWRQMVGWLAPGLPWPAGHISGPDNNIVDYPVRFYALVLDRPGAGPQKGQIYIDDITAWRGTVPAVAPTAAAGSTPVPEATMTTPPTSGAATPVPSSGTPSGVFVPSPLQLMAPKQDKTIDNPIVFEWMGLLGPGQSFVVHAWNSEPGHGYVVDSPPLSGSTWGIEAPGEAYGEWKWVVRVVQDGMIVVTSTEGKFWFDPMKDYR